MQNYLDIYMFNYLCLMLQLLHGVLRDRGREGVRLQWPSQCFKMEMREHHQEKSIPRIQLKTILGLLKLIHLFPHYFLKYACMYVCMVCMIMYVCMSVMSVCLYVCMSVCMYGMYDMYGMVWYGMVWYGMVTGMVW